MPLDRLTTNPASGYSDAVTVTGQGRLIHVSGSVGFGADGKVVDGGMGAEADATFDNLERTLHESGATLGDIVKINAFVTSLDDYADYAEVRQRRLGGAMPASATVQVAGLLVGAQIEIDAVAFVDAD